ncbi:MAG TPA: hypothetical protein VMZ27_04150 [Candidatus Saccharimonadales bacterium]|nr:hypothetical protein [Candidatus Saccharimonadales bacterium]
MKTCQRLSLFSLCLLALLSACSKPQQAGPVKLEDVPSTMQKAFAGGKTKTEVTEAVEKTVAEVQQGDPNALSNFQSLSARDDVTPEQRSAVARSMATYMKHLQQEAEKGNTKAKEAIDKYVATK